MTDFAGYAQACRQARPKAGPDLEIDDEQLAEWTRLLAHRAGLFIAPARRSFLVSGIRARMRESNCPNAREYYERLLHSRSDTDEWSLLVDRLTVHETCFFRHSSSLRLVSEQLLPEALERGTGFSAWSVGCASGEEAYSLAMLVAECAAGSPNGLDWRITGMDISKPSLQQAREGKYLLRRLRDIPQAFQDSYCRKVSGSHFRVTDPLRDRVQFSELDLRDLSAVETPSADLVYCQNLLIYYERQRRIEIVDQLANCLRTGGVLVLGPGELLDWNNPNMEKVRFPDTLAYRRTN